MGDALGVMGDGVSPQGGESGQWFFLVPAVFARSRRLRLSALVCACLWSYRSVSFTQIHPLRCVQMSVRCPLCKEEGITVPAHEVELTDNGKRAREPTEWDAFGEAGGGGSGGGRGGGAGGGKDGAKKGKGKAAPSNLKWGGGHGKEKSSDEKRRRFEKKSGAKSKVGLACHHHHHHHQQHRPHQHYSHH